jgi:hypothetical protein
MRDNLGENMRENTRETMGAMGDTGPGATWPADIVHVNEDGWVLINRGRRHGVPAGMRLLVIGAGTREIGDLFAQGLDEADTPPVVLRTRRTYELLEVVHVEDASAIAIAARTAPNRRPQFYRGPEGELLIWVPLPADFTYPKPGDEDDDLDDEDEDLGSYNEADEADGAGDASEGSAAVGTDSPPQRAEQEDERWEQALPLNGVSVGDRVVPAVPAAAQPGAAGGASTMSGPAASSGESSGATFEQGRSYDWMKPPQ